MILTQTAALFADAYRELNARKLFWITMTLSVLVAASLATLGIDEQSAKFLGFRLGFLPLNTDVIPARVFYLAAFSSLGIGLWLTWAATILALISTASIIPDLISGGVIETLLSKPISRTRLLLTKFLTGLLFVALQVGVFAVLSMCVIGIRGGYWEPRILLAIPIVVTFYSYLFAVCMLVGLVTRSTLAAILLTALFWGMLFGINLTDHLMVQFSEAVRLQAEERESRLDLATNNTVKLIRRANGDDAYTPSTDEIETQNPFLQGMRLDLEEDKEDLERLQKWHRLVFGIKSIVPKTGETIELLNRWMIAPDAFNPPPASDDAPPELDQAIEVDQSELARRVDARYRARSLSWILGTSLAFEAVVLGLCVLIFSRRDF